MDALAAPFVQGRLSGRELSGVLSTACAHCGRQLEIEIDSRMRLRVVSPGAKPLISTPFVSFKRLKAPNIIDAF